MGRPTLYWNGNTLDLGVTKIQDLDRAGLAFEGGRRFAGAGQTTVVDLYDRFTIKKGPFADASVYHALRAFEAWAMAGNPFGFAMDADDRVDTVLEADPDYLDILADGFELWSGSPLIPEGWTVTTPGSSAVERETKREDVATGLYAVRLDVDSSVNQPSIEITTASVPASASCVLTYMTKASADDGLELRIQHAGGNYLQDSGTWSGSTNEVTSDGATGAHGMLDPMPAEYGRASHAFDNDSSDGALTIRIQAPNTANLSAWVDDLRLYVDSKVIPVRSTVGVTASSYYQLVSRVQQYREMVLVDSVSAGASVTLNALPKRQYEGRDVLRSVDWWPSLMVDQKAPPLWEVTANRYRFELKCRAVGTGRA